MQSRSVTTRAPELKDVIPSAIHALVPGLIPAVNTHSLIDIPRSSHVVVCLIDGLGELQLQDFGAGSFLIRSMTATTVSTQFPSTTPVALGSLGTGETPGRHGFVGASFFLPEEGALLAPLKWGSSPHPIAMTPSTPLFEWAAENGIDVASIAREKYRNSGLTKSVLRGGVYLGGSGLRDIEQLITDRIKKTKTPALTYVYWPDLDRVGHVHGPGSPQWMEEFKAVDSFVARIANSIMTNPHSDISLVVTSDHGMVTCPIESRVHIESNIELTRDMTFIAGDPRARHIYTRPGAARDAASRWQSVLGSDFLVVLRDDLVRGSLFPDLDADFTERLGDFMVISGGNAMLASNTDSRTSSLLGQHGSTSEAEMLIPFRLFHSGQSN